MLLVFLLLILPVIGTIVGLVFYSFQGKKDLLKIDIVQFYYTFVLSPIVFVWLKTMMYLLLQANSHHLSMKEIFAIDTAFSVVFLLVFAFVAMHSVTKTFNLKNKDPLYDFFFDSEYIHLWLSHLAMAFGAISILTAVSFVNLWLPLDWNGSSSSLPILLVSAFIVGLTIYLSLELSDPKQVKRFSFMRLMKLAIGLVFALHILMFAIKTPPLTLGYAPFWFMMMAFFGASLLGFFTYKSAKMKKWIDLFVNKKLIYKDLGWGDNIKLFDTHKSSEDSQEDLEAVE